MKCKAYKPNEVSTRALVARLALMLYLGLVCFLCFGRFDSLPEVSRSFLGLPTDKIVHFCMFFPFAIIAYFAKDRANRNLFQSFSFFLIICAAGCIIAGITEIIQGSLPYRSEDMKDYATDCLAVGISSLLVLIYDIRHIRHIRSTKVKCSQQ